MNIPPADFEELRNYSIELKSGTVQIGLGKKSIAALTEMVDKPDAVATRNIVRLSRRLGISCASLSRMSRLLGYNNFPQFQDVFTNRTALAKNFYSLKALKLCQSSGKANKQMIQGQLSSATSNIGQCVNNLDEAQLDFTVRLLARANSVYIFGHKQSSAVAQILKYGLRLVRKRVHGFAADEQGVAIAVGQLEANDLVVIVSSSPYSALTLDVVSELKAMSCQVLAITDAQNSPVSQQATETIVVPTAGDFYSNSLGANVIVVESLLSLVAIELGQSAVVKLENHENLVRKFKVS
ncbi:MAG: MurR/RpiR family transcriptional regulator [Kangiellaceae bacterium]|nr:MurR/RpiR family transcriptional regulator [Kangiellaceae bacterium]